MTSVITTVRTKLIQNWKATPWFKAVGIAKAPHTTNPSRHVVVAELSKPMRRCPDRWSRNRPVASTVESSTGLKRLRIGKSWWIRPMDVARYTATQMSSKSHAVTLETDEAAGVMRGTGATGATAGASRVIRTLAICLYAGCRDRSSSRFCSGHVFAQRREDGARYSGVVATRPQNRPHRQWLRTFSPNHRHDEPRGYGGASQQADWRP